MIRYYLTTNTRRNEPECVKNIEYRHIKGRYDGDQTLIRCEEEISSLAVQELTFEEAQQLLNDWIDYENVNYQSVDVDGNIVIQPYLNLGIF